MLVAACELSLNLTNEVYLAGHGRQSLRLRRIEHSADGRHLNCLIFHAYFEAVFVEFVPLLAHGSLLLLLLIV